MFKCLVIKAFFLVYYHHNTYLNFNLHFKCVFGSQTKHDILLLSLLSQTGLEKVSFHSNPKECSNYRTIALISHASKVMLKILQARLQQYVNRGLPDVQAGFRKGRGTRDQIANICWIMEKAREFQKKHLFLLY